MLGYYLRLALRTMRRSPLGATIVVAGIAVGIGVAMTFVTIHHVMARDPIPERSASLYYVQLDSWDPDRPYPGRGADTLPTQVTYQDAVALARSTVPSRSTILYRASPVVRPEGEGQRPFRATARAARSDFFTMFAAPFATGGPWSRDDDRERRHVVVLSRALSERLFGSSQSVGWTVVLEDRRFEVVGVLDDWKPSVRHYDMTTGAFAGTEELYLPFDVAIAMELPSTGNRDGWTANPEGPESAFRRGLRSEMVWLQMWVEFDAAGQREQFTQVMNAHVTEQKRNGRFARPMNNRLTTLPELMDLWEVVPSETKTVRVVALLFLGLCVVSVVSLLLGSFLTRSTEVGIRRALGASRTAIFTQLLTESTVLGAIGGAVGIGLSFALLAWMQTQLPSSYEIELALDLPMLGLAVLLSLLSGIAAGMYPAWRVCATPAADHLKA